MDVHSLLFFFWWGGNGKSICSAGSAFQPEEGGPAEQKLLVVRKVAVNKFNPFVVWTLIVMFLKLDNPCLTLLSQNTQHLTVILCFHRAHSNLEMWSVWKYLSSVWKYLGCTGCSQKLVLLFCSHMQYWVVTTLLLSGSSPIRRGLVRLPVL